MSSTRPSAITPEMWKRLLEAFDSGLPAPAACRRAGIDYAVWDTESKRVPEFDTEAGRVETSGLDAAMRFLQAAAATEWRAALEYTKLYYSLRGREVARVDQPAQDDLETDLTPEAVAAVIRVLRAHELGDADGTTADGRSNGHAAGPKGASEVIE